MLEIHHSKHIKEEKSENNIMKRKNKTASGFEWLDIYYVLRKHEVWELLKIKSENI